MSEKTRILVVDDEEIVRESLSGWLTQDGFAVETAPDGPSAVQLMTGRKYAVVLVDLKMPGMDGLEVLGEALKLLPGAQVVLMTAFASVDTAVAAIKRGAYDYLVKPFDPEELSLLLQKVCAQQQLVHENQVLRKALKRGYSFHDVLSKSPAMQKLFELARVAAPSQSTVLILGESGTGKEVLARAVHEESPRRAGPFVAISCAALTESLLESELFGHERGAFTGASVRRKGKFEAAQGGTLFLDEIGDISPKLQVDLLRVLEERKVSRVGGNEAIPVDVRIIAATHRDLGKEVAEGRFRQDLFYRLNVIPMHLPPLRERREDLPLLIERFLDGLSVELSKRLDGVSPEALSALVAHDWPGNVRELRNVLERGAVVAEGRIIQLADLGMPPATVTPRALPAGERSFTGAPRSLDDVEKRHIAEVLAYTHGNVTQSAKILEIDRVTLYSKMKRYQLQR